MPSKQWSQDWNSDTKSAEVFLLASVPCHLNSRCICHHVINCYDEGHCLLFQKLRQQVCTQQHTSKAIVNVKDSMKFLWKKNLICSCCPRPQLTIRLWSCQVVNIWWIHWVAQCMRSAHFSCGLLAPIHPEMKFVLRAVSCFLQALPLGELFPDQSQQSHQCWGPLHLSFPLGSYRYQEGRVEPEGQDKGFLWEAGDGLYPSQTPWRAHSRKVNKSKEQQAVNK